VVSAADPPGSLICFLDSSRYFSFKWLLTCANKDRLDPVPGPLLLRKSSRAGNRTRDHRGGHIYIYRERERETKISGTLSPSICANDNFMPWFALDVEMI
jgi:hypothetical protein